MKKVTIYTTDYCPFCDKAKSFLDGYGIQYSEIDVTHDQEERQKLIEMTGGKKTVPQIFIGDKNIGGFSELSHLSKFDLENMLKD